MKVKAANGLDLDQSLASDRDVGVPVLDKGVVKRYKAKRIRILTPWDIARLLLHGGAYPLNEDQIRKIEARGRYLESR